MKRHRDAVESQQRLLRRAVMFNSLGREVEKSEDESLSQTERSIRYLTLAFAVIVFGGIFMGMWFLEHSN
jgi:hypothetical protein